MATALYKYSQDITVVDIDDYALGILQKLNPKISTICEDFNLLKLERKFALAICIEAFPYFHNLDKFFMTINAALANHGKFIFTYSNTNSWRFFCSKLTHRKKDNSYRETTFEDLKEIIEYHGFVIDAINGMNWMPLKMISNSPLVDFFELLEEKFRLNTWHKQSPILLIALKKKS